MATRRAGDASGADPQEWPAGFVYVPDFISADEEAALLALLDSMAFEEVRMHGVVARRTVRHFGYDYGYGSRRVEPGDPLPADLEWVRKRAAELADVPAPALAEILVSRYPPGATIGWHRDAPMFGSEVVGVSLGSACSMRFRRTAAGGDMRVFAAELLPRSAYVIGGAARWTWQHRIPPTKQLRYSLTFRTLRPTRADGDGRDHDGPSSP